MQIVACPDVEYVSKQDIPEYVIASEEKIELGKGDLNNKPDSIRASIVKGRIEKRLKELSLLDQAFIRNPDISIANLIEQKIALLGENIKVRRFQKFILGEGIEKNNVDFSKEVADILQN